MLMAAFSAGAWRQHNPTSYTAADLVNTLTEAELARILHRCF